jgi:DUF971 family protein
MQPLSLKQLGPAALGIAWDDGHESVYEVRHLRLACPCASCVHEWTGQSLLDKRAVALDVRPSEIKPVGRYALQFFWSDGHATGIYSYDLLRKLCECGKCER